jgi:hypothetical protein
MSAVAPVVMEALVVITTIPLEQDKPGLRSEFNGEDPLSVGLLLSVGEFAVVGEFPRLTNTRLAAVAPDPEVELKI